MKRLLSNYMSRYGYGIGLYLLFIIITSFLASRIPTDTQIALWTGSGEAGGVTIFERFSFLVIVIAHVATVLVVGFGFITALLGAMIPFGEIGQKWNRAALTLPASQRTISTAQWIEIVIVPTALVTITVAIIKIANPQNLFGLEISDWALAKAFFGSICFTGSACFCVQTLDWSERRFGEVFGTSNRKLKLGVLNLSAFAIAGVYLIGLGWVFHRWPEMKPWYVAMLATSVHFTYLSFRRRHELPHMFESYRRINKYSKTNEERNTADLPAGDALGFSGIYARSAKFTTVCTICAFPIWVPMLSFSNVAKDGDGLALLMVSMIFPLIISYLITPSLKTCRFLPLKTSTLISKLYAFPVTVFVTYFLMLIPLILLATNWSLFHSLCIFFTGFGFTIFLFGLGTILKEYVLSAIIGFLGGAVFISIFIFGTAPLNFFVEVIWDPRKLFLIGATVLFFGTLMWHRAAHYSSNPYRASLMNHDEGKFVR